MGRSYKPKSQVHKSSSSAEREFPILKGTNHAQWKRFFRDRAGLYGTAGRELSTGIREDFEPKLRTHYYDDTKITPMGRIVTIKKKWDRTAQRLLEAENRLRAERKREHERQQGILWTKLIQAIGHDIMDDIKARFKDEYEVALSKNDTFTLLELVMRSSAFACRVQKGYLRYVFEKHHQGKNKYSKFLTEFEQHMENLELAGEVMTDVEKTCALRDKLSEGWGAIACPEAYNQPEGSEKFPKYDFYKGNLGTYDSTINAMNWSKQQKTQDRSGGDEEKKVDQKPPNQKGDRKKKGDRKEKQEPANPVEDQGQVLAVMAEDLKTLKKAIEKQGGRKRKQDKAEGGSKGEENSNPCWNCGKTGHRYFNCEEDPAKCPHCNKKGHLGKYCEPATEQDRRHAETLKASKKKKAKKGSAESLTVISEKPLTPKAPETRILGNFLMERGSVGSLIVVSEKSKAKEADQSEVVAQNSATYPSPQPETSADRADTVSDKGTADSTGVSEEQQKEPDETWERGSRDSQLSVMHPDDVHSDSESENGQPNASDNSVIEIEPEEYVKTKAEKKKVMKSVRDEKWSAQARAINAKRRGASSSSSTPRKTSANNTPRSPPKQDTPTRASERVKARNSAPSTPRTPVSRPSTPHTPIPPAPDVNPWTGRRNASGANSRQEEAAPVPLPSEEEEGQWWPEPPMFEGLTVNPVVSPCDRQGMTEEEAMRQQCTLNPNDVQSNMLILSLVKERYNVCNKILRVADKVQTHKGFTEETQNVRKKLNKAAKELKVKIGDCPPLSDPGIYKWQVALWNGLAQAMTHLRERSRIVDGNFRTQEGRRQWVEMFSVSNPWLPPKNRSRTPERRSSSARSTPVTTPVTTPRTKRGKHSPKPPSPAPDSDDDAPFPPLLPRPPRIWIEPVFRPSPPPTPTTARGDEMGPETYERLPDEDSEFDRWYKEDEPGQLNRNQHRKRLNRRERAYKRWKTTGRRTAEEEQAIRMSQEPLTVREQEELRQQRCQERVEGLLAAEAVEDYERNALPTGGTSSSSGPRMVSSSSSQREPSSSSGQGQSSSSAGRPGILRELQRVARPIAVIPLPMVTPPAATTVRPGAVKVAKNPKRGEKVSVAKSAAPKNTGAKPTARAGEKPKAKKAPTTGTEPGSGAPRSTAAPPARPTPAGNNTPPETQEEYERRLDRYERAKAPVADLVSNEHSPPQRIVQPREDQRAETRGGQRRSESRTQREERYQPALQKERRATPPRRLQHDSKTAWRERTHRIGSPSSDDRPAGTLEQRLLRQEEQERNESLREEERRRREDNRRARDYDALDRGERRDREREREVRDRDLRVIESEERERRKRDRSRSDSRHRYVRHRSNGSHDRDSRTRRPESIRESRERREREQRRERERERVLERERERESEDSRDLAITDSQEYEESEDSRKRRYAPLAYVRVSRQALETAGLRARVATYINGDCYYTCVDKATDRNLGPAELKNRLNRAKADDTHPGGEIRVCVLPKSEVERLMESGAVLDPVPVLGYILGVRRARRRKKEKNQTAGLVRWIVLDSGATVSLLQNLGFLGRYDDLNLEMVLQAANGATITSTTVVNIPGFGKAAVSSQAPDNLLSIRQMCKVNPDLEVKFKGTKVTMSHPNLTRDIRTQVHDGGQYRLTLEQFEELQRALCGENTVFAATSMEEMAVTDFEPSDEELEEGEIDEDGESGTDEENSDQGRMELTEESTQNSSPEPTNPSQDPAATEPSEQEATQQVLHDTRVELPPTAAVLRRAKETET